MCALNIPPIRPISMPPSTPPSSGGGIGVGGGLQSGSLGRKRNPYELDLSKIGQGRRMREGTYGTASGAARYSGLRGQLKKMQMTGRHGAVENLSNKNIEQIHDILDARIKKHPSGSGTYLSRRDKLEIMKESRDLARTHGSGFTMEDRKDLEKIVDTMREEYHEQRTHHNDVADTRPWCTMPASEIAQGPAAPPPPVQTNFNRPNLASEIEIPKKPTEDGMDDENYTSSENQNNQP